MRLLVLLLRVTILLLIALSHPVVYTWGRENVLELVYYLLGE